MNAFRLLEVLPDVPWHVRPLDSPMIGRERELQALADAFVRAVAERSCHLFTVLGAAGVGKSRLVREALAQHRRPGPAPRRHVPALRRGHHVLAGARGGQAGHRHRRRRLGRRGGGEDRGDARRRRGGCARRGAGGRTGRPRGVGRDRGAGILGLPQARRGAGAANSRRSSSSTTSTPASRTSSTWSSTSPSGRETRRCSSSAWPGPSCSRCADWAAA